MKKTFVVLFFLIFTTAVTHAQEDKPKAVFEGTYLHRAGSQDIVTAKMTLVPVDDKKQFIVSTQIGKDKFSFSFAGTQPVEYVCVSGENSDYELRAVFQPNIMTETRFSAGERVSKTEYDIRAENAVPLFTSRPDPFCFLFHLLDRINSASKEPQTLTVYDIDSGTRSVFDYKMSVTLADEDGIALPNGKFKAKHFVLEPLGDGRNLNKRNKPSRTDIWLDGNLNILRVYRFRESYELILQDYNNPEGLIDANDKMQAYKVPASDSNQDAAFDARKVEGETVFKGIVKHSVNNREIVKEKLCVKKQQDGTMVYIADMAKMVHVVFLDKDGALMKYYVYIENGNVVEHIFEKELMKISAADKKTDYKINEGTYPDIAIRPDPFLLPVAFLKKFDYNQGTPAEFTLFDRGKKADAMCEYKIKVQKIGEEELAVGSSKIKTIHLAIEQLESSDTLFKRDKGTKMELWITPDCIPVRFVKPVERYEAILVEKEK